VQKLADERLLEPWQHACPSPPQAPQPPYALDEHLPVSVPPHAAPASTHFPPAQHDAPLHSWCPQHGSPLPPQLWNAPSRHTLLAVEPDSPGAMHVCSTGSRQAPLEHDDAPGHAGVPATPQ
jgi:hypothetical protein